MQEKPPKRRCLTCKGHGGADQKRRIGLVRLGRTRQLGNGTSNVVMEQRKSSGPLVLAARAQATRMGAEKGMRREAVIQRVPKQGALGSGGQLDCSAMSAQAGRSTEKALPVEAALQNALCAQRGPATEVDGKHALRRVVVHRDENLLVEAHVERRVLRPNKALQRLRATALGR